ncbi:MAG: AMP-dependent synthetase and ligase [Mycobacterium sp.]|jgi:acyl-CoA synthetase (AMP-forming)/AMP-acid ligase II|nr:AMP-dependent synthetase and ligase [Mycobacterium sp.]
MAHCGTDGTATLVLRADPAGRFDAGVTDNGAVPVTFVVGESVSSPTVAQIRDDAMALAAALQRLGIRPADAVAVQLTNRAECAALYQAVLLCGEVLVPIVHIFGMAEVSLILAESGAKVLIMPDRWRSTSSCWTPSRGRATSRSPSSTLPAMTTCVPLRSPNDVRLLLYTSGTTSAPPGHIAGVGSMLRPLVSGSRTVFMDG